jgi:hypothetical protein
MRGSWFVACVSSAYSEARSVRVSGAARRNSIPYAGGESHDTHNAERPSITTRAGPHGRGRTNPRRRRQGGQARERSFGSNEAHTKTSTPPCGQPRSQHGRRGDTASMASHRRTLASTHFSPVPLHDACSARGSSTASAARARNRRAPRVSAHHRRATRAKGVEGRERTTEESNVEIKHTAEWPVRRSGKAGVETTNTSSKQRT